MQLACRPKIVGPKNTKAIRKSPSVTLELGEDFFRKRPKYLGVAECARDATSSEPTRR